MRWGQAAALGLLPVTLKQPGYPVGRRREPRPGCLVGRSTAVYLTSRLEPTCTSNPAPECARHRTLAVHCYLGQRQGGAGGPASR
jgi:hypothetical protein